MANLTLTLSDAECREWFLEPDDISLFQSFAFFAQKNLLNEWKDMKPFLSHFPTETLPEHYLSVPRGRKQPELKFYYGWRVEWETISEWVKVHLPNNVVVDDSGKLEPAFTALDSVKHIADERPALPYS
ncbi:hypothetical protein D9757_009905 [Collybiopsis confluens]|uniref:Uncharacterized protein n=1 Tax=Collybiopsis confluens TaxID=2823264 RepID=A0A8H5GX59_9AGAR|nr:hypothetical protein D9757_009905 [Collybiopsis confluens]